MQRLDSDLVACNCGAQTVVAERLKRLLPRWTPFQRADVSSYILAPGERVWRNSLYTVFERPLQSDETELPGRWVHLSIKRHDREAIHDWRDLQRIKNEIVGEEAEGIEIYPAESRLVDNANQYHLWCVTGVRVPIGFTSRLVTEADIVLPSGTSRQRPFRDDERPADLLDAEAARRRYEAYVDRRNRRG
jgi:hypothetical protein